VSVGTSLAERDLADTARQIEAKAAAAGCQIHLQVDACIAAELAAGVAVEDVAIDAVPADRMILDIGPQSVAQFADVLARARTLVWNGPVGAFEFPPFDRGTMALAERAADLTEAGQLRSVAGGGDTVAALGAAGVQERFSYVSTAGGAFLEWLEGKDLPGVAVLSR
jgi:phosphoglycerate kinase